MTEEVYESIVLRPKYSDYDQTTDNIDSMKKNNTIVDDDGNTYEVLVISEDSDPKPTIETEFEEFELLEVDNFDVNNELTDIISVEPAQSEKIQSKECEKLNDENQTIEFMETNELDNDEDKEVISTRTRSKRKSKITMKKETDCEIQSVGRTTRQAAKMKIDSKKHIKNLKKSKKTPIPSVKIETVEKSIVSKENCETQNIQQDFDGVEGESDDEFPARDSDNEDWPSQVTLSDFPKQIIKDGLLQVKGKELMSLICR